MTYSPAEKKDENKNNQPQQSGPGGIIDSRSGSNAISQLQTLMKNPPAKQSLGSIAQYMANSPAQIKLQSNMQLMAKKHLSIAPIKQSSNDQAVIQGAFIQTGNLSFKDEETGHVYEQIEVRVDNRVKVKNKTTGKEIYLEYNQGKWFPASEMSAEKTTVEEMDDSDEEFDTDIDLLDYGYEMGSKYAEEGQGENKLNEESIDDYFYELSGKMWSQKNYQLFSQGFTEGYNDIVEENGWNSYESKSELESELEGNLYEERESDSIVESMEQEDESLFIPNINYGEEELDLEESEQPYDHSQWILRQKQQHKNSVLIAARNHSNLSSSELSDKSKNIFSSVVNTGIHSDRAVYTPRKWVEKLLPQMTAEGKKMVAGDIFNSWMKNNSVDTDEVPRLNRKLQSLQTQFGLHSSHLVKNAQDQKVYAELKASPSIFVPVKTASLSGLLGKPSKTDKLDAVQYDGPELSPLGQFLKNINKHFQGKDFDGAGSKLPKLNKGDTLLDNSNDNITELSYRPGTVEAISTQTRGTGRSGSGESKVGRMGVQEELINTGQLNNKQYEGGHLIGDQIMDPGKFNLYESWNLAPQENQFNAPVYSSTMENGATRAVDKGGELHVKAEVSYPSDTYEVPVLTLIDRVMDGKNKNIGSSSTSWHDGVDYIQKNTKSLPDKFKFMTRIPGYWHANAKDVNAKGEIQGSVTNRDEGVQVLTGISAGSIYNPTGTERFRFSVFTDGDSSTGTVLPLPAKPLSKPKSEYKKANSVYIYARQKTHVVGAPSNDMRAMSVTQINAVVNNSARSNDIKKWLVANPNVHTINNLGNIKGVGAVTLKKIIAAGWTI